MELIEWANNNEGFMLGILTFVYVIATIGIFYSSIRSNKLSQQSIVAFTSPHVFVDLSLDVDKDELYLRIKNGGCTSAKDVVFRFNNLESLYLDNNVCKFPDEVTISCIGPNVEYRIMLDRLGSFKARDDIKLIEGNLSYNTPTGIYNEIVCLKTHIFHDSFLIVN